MTLKRTSLCEASVGAFFITDIVATNFIACLASSKLSFFNLRLIEIKENHDFEEGMEIASNIDCEIPILALCFK